MREEEDEKVRQSNANHRGYNRGHDRGDQGSDQAMTGGAVLGAFILGSLFVAAEAYVRCRIVI
jgi:hypothetical protein